ncbi:hypothetical protein [Dietzia sp. SYD-A1]|uniref:hypothetical protein n=1 Tax=Dietzia sp. SYD-A1 TaxID=2780141 RepID=UPI0018910228|nr:hypothetical protein [Dietzia sp. SYD-A1]
MLQNLGVARERIAVRITAPWWYRVGAALSTACLYVGMGLLVGRPAPDSGVEAVASSLIVLGACVAPVVLLWVLHRSTGVVIDRYAHGMAGWCVVMVSLLVVAFVFQAFLHVPFALAAAGVIAFVVTYDRECRLDSLLRQRVRAHG